MAAPVPPTFNGNSALCSQDAGGAKSWFPAAWPPEASGAEAVVCDRRLWRSRRSPEHCGSLALTPFPSPQTHQRRRSGRTLHIPARARSCCCTARGVAIPCKRSHFLAAIQLHPLSSRSSHNVCLSPPYCLSLSFSLTLTAMLSFYCKAAEVGSPPHTPGSLRFP